MTRRLPLVALVALATTGAVSVASRSASAQPATSSPLAPPPAPAQAETAPAQPSAPAAAPPVVVVVPVAPPQTPSVTPAPAVPASEPGQQSGAEGTGAGAPITAEHKPNGLLVPQYGEDFYPAMPKTDGLLTGIPIDEKHGLRFALHGYFRAPMRITRVPRAEGSTRPNEGGYNIRTPYLIDDDYFRSGFAYTPVNESDWAELYLSVGNDKLTATTQLQGTLYSDAARPIIDRQPGVSQGWLTYRTKLAFVPWFDEARLRVKAGAFWERFGHMPKYDTYIFSRIHQMGENVRFELEKDQWTFWLQHGIGTHLEDIAANQGLALLHYATVGASFARMVEVGGYIFDSTSKDKRPLKELTDSSMMITGVDLRADTHLFGRVYAATSYISAQNATYQAPALEVMHSFGGRQITENYLGTQSSENGTGSLWNVGYQYDLSLADTVKGWTGKASPLPWNGDLTASLFGLYTFVQSKQQSLDPLLNRDDRKSFKWGADAAYRITEWMAASLRYDRVVLDVDDSANSFRILSPRLAFFTSFLTREMIYVQYSRYVYNERIRLRPGQQQLETMPDDHVLKIQAQMTF
jgi:hypothetical protein